MIFLYAARSPIFTHVSSSLSGLTTLRAHQCEPIFLEVFSQCQNVHSSAYYIYTATARWFGIQMEMVAFLYFACITYICTALQGSKAIIFFIIFVFFSISFFGFFEILIDYSLNILL